MAPCMDRAKNPALLLATRTGKMNTRAAVQRANKLSFFFVSFLIQLYLKITSQASLNGVLINK